MTEHGHDIESAEEIEVTPEMLRAGGEAFQRDHQFADLLDEAHSAELAWDVVSAALMSSGTLVRRVRR